MSMPVGVKGRWKRAAAAVFAAALTVTGVALSVTPAQAASGGGPLVLMGIDAEDGGPGGHGPISTYVDVVSSILGDTSNGGDGILVLGGGGTNVTNFWNAVGSGTGETVTFVSGAAVGTQSFAGFQMIAVVSDYRQTFGGTTAAENQLLGARQGDVADFVNGGGGLLGFSSTFSAAEGGAYPYLAGVGSFTFDFTDYDNITPTPAGLAAGITDSLDVCCWHNQILTFPPFLQVLAANPLTGEAAAVGGVDVFISSIQLAPATQTLGTGDTSSLTATVTENGAPVAGATVTFEVLSGPNSGTTGTATTDASGEATFGYAGSSPGTDSVRASYSPSGGGTEVSNTVDVVWTGGNNAPTASAGGPYTGEEGSPVSLDGTAGDQDGDSLTLTWHYSVVSSDSGVSCSFGDGSAEDTTFTCTDDGEFEVTLEADDGTTSTTSSAATVTLSNAAPVITSLDPSTDAPVAVGTEVSFSAPFTDAGANDSHTCSVDWGDGSTSAGSVAGGECSASHTYSSAGIYTVELTVTDDDGDSDSRVYQYVTVYDPSAGFVTGGGTIDSPAGAYGPDPSLTGKASFGFVAKYKKGQTVPDGQTQFQFRAGGFDFHSTSYDWLVVAGARAQYKGSGTVNGSGDYEFMLTAVDGQLSGGGGVDGFRMKVRDKSTGAVVYDSQRGDTDDSAVTTPLTGGSIVIHKK